MARSRERKTLSESPEVQIEVQQLDAMRSLRLLHRLTKIVAPAVARLGGGKSLMEMDVGALGGAADALFANFSEQDLEEITKTLLSDAVARADGKELPCYPLGFGLAFDGRPDLILKALMFALELNYGPLFESARGLLGSRVALPQASA